MDVRCDLCQTEYELDDQSVSDAGASVQCTTCGHTFVVGRNGAKLAELPPTPPSGVTNLAGPQAADWLLATEDGQTHRFRDLTTLQKWVVERKVTREDRVSQKGGRWRQLSEVSELEPFFEVVAQADRARGADGPKRAPREPSAPSSGATPTRQTTVSRQTAARMERNSGGGSGGGGGSGWSAVRQDTARSQILLDPDASGADDEGFETSIIRNNRGRKIAVAAILGLAAIAAYIGFKQPHWLFNRSPETARVADLPAAPAPAPAVPPPAPVPQPAAAPPAAAAAPVAAAPPPSAPPAAAPVAPTIEPMPSRGPAERTAAEPLAGAKAKSYERLVAEADHLMENGQTGRAQKLIDEALALQPNGVAALTSSAYLLLDHEKQMAAISTFKRALGFAPEFPQALFGLAEAYRAEGDLPHAAENYRKYLTVAPGGSDAPAARRQLKDLEGAAPPKHSAVEPASAPESAKLEERPAPPAP